MVGRSGFAIVLLLLLAASGCVGGPAERDSAPRSIGPPQETSERSSGGVNPLGNLTVLASGCELFTSLVRTTRAVFQPTYPTGVDGYHSTLMNAHLDVLLCRQALVGSVVVENFQLVDFNSLNRLVSWAPTGDVQLFIHDLYSNSDVFVQAARLEGLQVQEMKSAKASLTPVARGQVVEIVAPAERADYTVKGTVDVQSSFMSKDTHVYIYDKGESLGHFVATFEGPTSSASPGTVSFGPSSYWAKHSDAPLVASTELHGTDMSVRFAFSSPA